MKNKGKEKKGVSYLLSLSGNNKYYMYFGCLGSILSGVCSFIPYFAVYNIMKSLFENNVNTDEIINYSIIAAVAIVFKCIFMVIGLGSTHIGAFNVLYKVRTILMNHMSKLNLGFFNDHTTGEIKKTIIEDVERLENFLAHQVPDIAAAVAVPIMMLIYMFTLSIPMTISIFVPFILGLLVQMIGMKQSAAYMKDYHTILGKLNSAILQFVSAMPEMKSFNMTTASFDEYRNSVQSFSKFWHDCTRSVGLPYTIFFVTINSGILFVLPIGGYLYLQGSIDIATFLFFLIMSMVFLSLLANLINFSQSFMKITSGIDHIKTLLDTPIPQTKGLAFDGDARDITLKNVSFAYDEIEVLNDVNIKIPQGSFTAFVGASGAGKTTAAQLIPKFWEVSKGSISINNKNINDVSEANLMNQLSFVFQEAFMLNDTVYENIAIGKKDCSEEDVFNAAKAAQIHDFIMSLPNGYQTKLGEDGVKFSGGEKQRICIARAILKDSPIIIFDEATSYTDIENEHKIQLALNHLLQEKTTIMIAHRLHTIINADQICVFDEGKVVEKGTHKELLSMEGLYASMWNTYTRKRGEA